MSNTGYFSFMSLSNICIILTAFLVLNYFTSNAFKIEPGQVDVAVTWSIAYGLVSTIERMFKQYR